MRRCVGMADEGDSKSLVLITRVGSTPTTGIKRELLQLVWGSFFICLRRVSGSNSTALTKNVPETRTAPICQTVWYTAQEMGRFIFCAAASAFYLLRLLRVSAVPFCLIPHPQRGAFARCICVCSAARLFRAWLSVLPKWRTLARKKRRNAVPTIYSAVSYRFYNVFYKKDFTNEF